MEQQLNKESKRVDIEVSQYRRENTVLFSEFKRRFWRQQNELRKITQSINYVLEKNGVPNDEKVFILKLIHDYHTISREAEKSASIVGILAESSDSELQQNSETHGR